MNRRLLVIGVGLFVLAGATLAGARSSAVEALQAAHPGVRFFVNGDRVTRVYGPAFGGGTSAEASATGFVASYAGVLSAEADDLVPVSPLEDGRHTQPVMYDPASGTYKFTLVYFTQVRDGVPVFRADVRLLVRNEADYPLVLVSNGLRELGDFRVDPGLIESADFGAAQLAAQAIEPSLVNFSEPRFVIFAGAADDTDAEPRLAFVFEADNNLPASNEYRKGLFVADAASSAIVHHEDGILHTDVTGNISGQTTVDTKAAFCSGIHTVKFPYARAYINSNSPVFADADGNFSIPNSGTDPVSVSATLRGKYFNVVNNTGSSTVLSQTVTPPGPANFLFNADNNQEKQIAEANAYEHSNVIRDFLLGFNPSFPTINNQLDFRVNVNIQSTCNAYYDGSSINFFLAGGGCPNTAYSTIVHHEYGHHMVATAGSGQGEYGEGYADTMGVVITDESQLAWGFFNNCNEPLRDANNTLQYPCSGEIHYCGQLLSGCVWSTRNALLITEPSDYRTIISNLVVNSVLLHTGTSITPSITIDFLTLDDNNGNINDGTPHYDEIAAGFGAHNMDAPELDLLHFTYPNGLPGVVKADGTGVIRVVPLGIATQPIPGTGKLHYRQSPNDPYTTVDLVDVGGGAYDAPFPATQCFNTWEYYFSIDCTNGDTLTDPADAPNSAFSIVAANHATVVFADDFNNDNGWYVRNHTFTVGAWERGSILGGGENGVPPADFDGSGICWVTGRNVGVDLDGGPTRLFSPVWDLSAGGTYVVTYARWINQLGVVDDTMEVRLTNDGALTWVPADVSSNAASWVVRSFVVNNYVTPNHRVQLRVGIADKPNNATMEGGFDRFQLIRVDCGPDFDKGDLNCDGSLNGQDISAFVLAISSPEGYATQYPDCFIENADMNLDGSVNGQDIQGFVDALTP